MSRSVHDPGLADYLPFGYHHKAHVAADDDARDRHVNMRAERFEAELCSFSELINTTPSPVSLADVYQRLQQFIHEGSGSNFRFEKRGLFLEYCFPLVLWYANWDTPDVRTKASREMSFQHDANCYYIYQPVRCLTSLKISPRSTYQAALSTVYDTSLFPKNVLIKFAWRKYLDFGVSSYRVVIGDKLGQWTTRCRQLIAMPLNMTYWLMIMVGSYFREVLASRFVVRSFSFPSQFERVPVIHVDSLTQLQTVLFSSERQVLYAGIDPTPAYLQWLRFVGEQFHYRKHADPASLTVFEGNEFFDLKTVVVHYGKSIQHKKLEKNPMAWVANPELIRSFIQRYCEDNMCQPQLEAAVRLYTYTCNLGFDISSDKNRESFCWNGLKFCEIGVPMPCTQASFMAPFITLTPIVLACPIHGYIPAVASSPAGVWQSQSRGLSVDGCSDDGSVSVSEHDRRSSDAASSYDQEATSSGGTTSQQHQTTCCCRIYLPPTAPTNNSTQMGGVAGSMDGDEPSYMAALGSDYETVHAFSVVATGGLNLAKAVFRTHFAVDVAAYEALGASDWRDKILPWYKDFLCPDFYGRSRYTTVLEALVRAMLGNGFTSGYRSEVLDCLLHTDDDQSSSGSLSGASSSSNVAQAIVSPDAGEPDVNRILDRSEPVVISAKTISSSRGPGRRLVFPRKVDRYPSRGIAEIAYMLVGSGSGKAISARASVNSCRLPGTSNVASRRSSTNTSTTNSPRGLAWGGKRKFNVINDMSAVVDLYGATSQFRSQDHFEQFTQWCHSAHLVPFLVRVYRRSGVAGLVPRCNYQSWPPLVLPTVPSFCYGHSYPPHSILQYVYGGLRSVVRSVDDSAKLERDILRWRLLPGQDKPNFNCWFQYDSAFENNQSRSSTCHAPSVAKSGRSPSMRSYMPGRRRVDGSSPRRMRFVSKGSFQINKSHLNPSAPNQRGRSMSPVGMTSSSGSPSKPKTLTFANATRKANATPIGMQDAHPLYVDRHQELRPGLLVPSDAFFFFIKQNYSMFCHPIVPRHLLQHVKGGSGLEFKYTDFLSRDPSPASDHDIAITMSAAQAQDSQRAGVIHNTDKSDYYSLTYCKCHEPTDRKGCERVRRPVQFEFKDENGLILADPPLWPAALGHRFTYEVSTEDVSLYVRLGTVPAAHLLYMYTESTSGASASQEMLELKLGAQSTTVEPRMESGGNIVVRAESGTLPMDFVDLQV